MSEMPITTPSDSSGESKGPVLNVTMPDIARRSLLLGAITTGALGSLASQVQAQDGADVSKTDEKETKKPSEKEAVTGSVDRSAVLEAGMTEQEADCWRKIADAAGAFFQLPEMHPMDATEVASAVHVIQNKLLGRPTYRAYLAAHKAAAAKSPSPTASGAEKGED
ncbi:MAG: hypothetical protein ACE361_18070 [Aureliella sp.]